MKKNLFVVIIIFIILTGISLFLFPKEETKIEEVEELKGKVVLYFKGIDAMKLEKEYRNVSMDRIKEDMAKTIVEEVLKGPTQEELKTTIPEGTKLLAISMESNLVEVDLSKEFEENQKCEAADCLLAVYSIVNSLTEITEIEQVKILIEGEERDTYLGYFELNKPFVRSLT